MSFNAEVIPSKESRAELLDWVNAVLPSTAPNGAVVGSLRKVEQCGSGVPYVLILPDILPIPHAPLTNFSRAKIPATSSFERVANLKLVQEALQKNGIPRPDVLQDVNKLINGNFQANLQLLQWFKGLCDALRVIAVEEAEMSAVQLARSRGATSSNGGTHTAHEVLGSNNQEDSLAKGLVEVQAQGNAAAAAAVTLLVEAKQRKDNGDNINSALRQTDLLASTTSNGHDEPAPVKPSPLKEPRLALARHVDPLSTTGTSEPRRSKTPVKKAGAKPARSGSRSPAPSRRGGSINNRSSAVATAPTGISVGSRTGLTATIPRKSALTSSLLSTASDTRQTPASESRTRPRPLIESHQQEGSQQPTRRATPRRVGHRPGGDVPAPQRSTPKRAGTPARAPASSIAAPSAKVNAAAREPPSSALVEASDGSGSTETAAQVAMERQFYYDKLRTIENMVSTLASMETNGAEVAVVTLARSIRDVLHAPS